MANVPGRIGMKLMTIAVSIPIGIVAKKGVQVVWDTARPEQPPRKPEDQGVRWGDALAWAALSSAGVVIAELLTRRGAEELWRTVIGTEPPPPKRTRAQKKLEKAQDRVDILPG